jgi:hypothetical protein
VARPEGNVGDGQRPVVEVGGSRLGKLVGTRAVVGAASMERVCGRRRLVPVTPSRQKQMAARCRVAQGQGPTLGAMRAVAPVGGAQGLNGGALRATPIGEEAALGGQGSGGQGVEVRRERRRRRKEELLR